MNLSDSEILELNALCSAVVDGTLSAAQRARLNRWLADSEDARRFYVRAMALSASLHDYAGEMQADEPAPVIAGPAHWWTRGSLAAAAAAVLLALGLVIFANRDAAEKLAAADETEFVATLSGMTRGEWKGAAPAVGEALRRGRQLELVSGFAEITFDSGAQVILEGPAKLDLNSEWDAVLHRGSLKASVPPEAIGFRIWNADVEVTDLGTEFSMVAGVNGGTEVFVLEGAVQAAAGRDQKPVLLREQDAQRFEKKRVSEVRDREQKLKRLAAKTKLNQFTHPAGYVHWSFDEAQEAGVPARAFHLAERDVATRFALAGALHLADGHHQGALALDGSSFASGAVPAPRGGQGASVAFWVRVPAEATLADASAMVAWRSPRGPGFRQISWNRDPAHGVVGALRTETEHGFLVGTTPLRDNRWHHVAVVFGPGGKPRHYIDGRLEAASAKRFKGGRQARPATTTVSADMAPNTLWLGRPATAARDDGKRFRGAIDELFVADRALTPPEIRHLLREHRPVVPRTIAAAAEATPR